MWIFRFVLTHSAQINKTSHHFKMTKRILFVLASKKALASFAWLALHFKFSLLVDCHAIFTFQQKAIKNEKNKSCKIQACACFAFKLAQGLNLGIISCLRP